MSEPRSAADTVRRIMSRFAERTGLSTAARPPRRYLWTDAFAVCNFLELYAESEAEDDLEQAERLIDQVHRTLGRHRDDDRRTGWISGLSEEDGRARPTRGGLRIGKRLQERGPGEPYDPRLEWDRDGQYFHYLTRWMHALSRFAQTAGRHDALRWSLELAQAAYRGFAHTSRSGQPMLYWKTSIDLSRPLVPSMGHHDPLDGLITFLELRSAASRLLSSEHADLGAQIDALGGMCRGADWTTTDALGLGGLLTDGYRLAQLMARGEPGIVPGLLERALRSAAVGLIVLTRSEPFLAPAAERLAFRELGLAIGLHAIEPLEELVARNRLLFAGAAEPLTALRRFVPMAELIESFWLDQHSQSFPAWSEHLDINSVMLATSLAPATYLSI